MIFSAILIGESSCRAYIMAKKLWISDNKDITVLEKDFQIAIDVCIDLFFFLTPVAVIIFGI